MPEHKLTQEDVAKSRKRMMREYYDVSGWVPPAGFGVNSPKFGTVAVKMLRRINKKEFPNLDPDVWNKGLTARINNKIRPPVTGLDIAKGFIGPIETKGNNLGPLVAKVQSATDLPPGPWPYCAAGVYFCLEEAEWKFEEAFRINELEAWVPGWTQAAMNQKYGMQIVPIQNAIPNDVIVFNWAGVRGPARDYDHIGFVRTKLLASGVIGTREFNTGPGAGGNQSDGDGCWDRWRPNNAGILILRGGWNYGT